MATVIQSRRSRTTSTSGSGHPVTVIEGDGVGPEVVRATKRVIAEAGGSIAWHEAEAGGRVFARGLASGVPDETIASIMETGVVLKGPLATPVGFGEKSANVTLRGLFETYANVRPARELPGVSTPFSGRGVDLVVIRENVEDLYTGIEHMQSPDVAQSLKVVSRKGCEKIVRFAFEYAVAEGRKKIHCATKANIMKLTEGLLKKTFEAIAPEYPQIEAHHIIIDNCCHQLAMRPEQFDVIVCTNMNGDIVSDLTSGLTGGLGFAPSANIGNDVAMFEAVHGSAPDIAGRDLANPTALLLSACMMLRHLGEFDVATRIEQAVLVTVASGDARTADMVGIGEAASTTTFTDTVISNLGRTTGSEVARHYGQINLPRVTREPAMVFPKDRTVVGVDVFVESLDAPEQLGDALAEIVEDSGLTLRFVTNKGSRVYPPTGGQTDPIDIWRARFQPRDPAAELSDGAIFTLLERIGAHCRWVHVEKLQRFDGEDAFSHAKGD